MATSLTSLAGFADLVAEGLAERLWLGQAVKVDPHQLFSHLSGSGVRVPTGTAVTLVPLRNPYEAALQARSVSLLSGQSHVAGFGAGSRRFVEATTGAPYHRPLPVMREYLEAVRGLLAGESVHLDGEHVQLQGRLVEIAPGAASVEVGAGVLRAGMGRVAGAAADVAITWLTPPEHITSTLLPAFAEGARDAGRRGQPRVVSVVHVLLDRAGRDPLHQVLTASAGHLSMPHYQRMLQSAGGPVQPGDPVLSAAHLLEGGVYCYGDPASVADQLTRWSDAGVDEVALNVAGALFTEGEDAALVDLREILLAVAAAGIR